MDNEPRPPVVICRWTIAAEKGHRAFDPAEVIVISRAGHDSPSPEAAGSFSGDNSGSISRDPLFSGPPSTFEPPSAASAAVEEAAAGDKACVRELQLVSRGAPSSVRRQRRCVRLRLGQALVPVPGVLLALPLYALLFDVVVPTSSVTLRLDFRRSQRSKTSITCETGMLSCRAGRQSGRRSQSLVVPP
jgi:hypothetical protein